MLSSLHLSPTPITQPLLTQRVDDKNHRYFELEFTANKPERHQLAVVTVAQGTPAKRDGTVGHACILLLWNMRDHDMTGGEGPLAF